MAGSCSDAVVRNERYIAADNDFDIAAASLFIAATTTSTSQLQGPSTPQQGRNIEPGSGVRRVTVVLRPRHHHLIDSPGAGAPQSTK
jgi:hypothetical protein